MEEVAMTVKIPLRLRGLDLRDANAYTHIAPDLAEVHDELVSVSDIAARAGVAAEAARLWAAGKRRASLRPFPAPRQVVGRGSGGKSMSLYTWREVVSWIRDVIGIDPDEGIDYLNEAEHAYLNAELAANAASAGAWHPIDVGTTNITTDVRGPRCVGRGVVRLLDVEPLDGPSTTGRRGTLRVALT